MFPCPWTNADWRDGVILAGLIPGILILVGGGALVAGSRYGLLPFAVLLLYSWFMRKMLKAIALEDADIRAREEVRYQQLAAQAATIEPGLVAHSVEYQGARLVLRNLHTQQRMQLCEGDVVVLASPVCFSPYLQHEEED